MRGYVVVFEEDDEYGYSAYSPDLPAVVAAADTRAETEQLMREAMAERLIFCFARPGNRYRLPPLSPSSIRQLPSDRQYQLLVIASGSRWV